jgi:glycogen phosphorylase
VAPLFYERGRDGVPHGWIARVKATLRTIGPRFCATRMMDEYERRIYAAEPRRVGATQSSS